MTFEKFKIGPILVKVAFLAVFRKIGLISADIIRSGRPNTLFRLKRTRPARF